MSKVSIELTKEQREQLAVNMGMVCDELILSYLDSDDKNLKVGDLGENLILAMGNTWTVS
ncbi:hypothetical protein AAK706_01960 [Erysipelotrichaceae bacterium 66-17]